MFLQKNLAILLFCVLTAGHAGGCATRGEKMVDSFGRTRERVAKAQGQVDRTLGALNEVRTARADNMKDAFRRYHADVDTYFTHRTGDLLRRRLCEGDGWKPLCEFLGKRTPLGPFPHMNSMR